MLLGEHSCPITESDRHVGSQQPHVAANTAHPLEPLASLRSYDATYKRTQMILCTNMHALLRKHVVHQHVTRGLSAQTAPTAEPLPSAQWQL